MNRATGGSVRPELRHPVREANRIREKIRKEPKKPKGRFDPFRSGKTAQLQSPPAGPVIPASTRMIKNKQSNNACH